MHLDSIPVKAQQAVARAEGKRKRFILLVVTVSAIVLIPSAAFVITLPPRLTISDGSVTDAIQGDFPTFSSNNSLPFLFNATTYANQTQGPSSSLMIRVQGYAYWISFPSISDSWWKLHTWLTVSVTGHFAPNIHPTDLVLACNGTGSDMYADMLASFSQGVNVSFNRNHPVGFHDIGSGDLRIGLTNQGSSGHYHDFNFTTVVQMDQYRAYQAFIGFRATVTGWMLPSIAVGMLLHTVSTHKVVTLFSSGQSWTIAPGESKAIEFDVYTAYLFGLTGSLLASGPVTAYIVNQTTWIAQREYGPPVSWSWTSGPGVSSASINTTLQSEISYLGPNPWYLIFVNSDPVASVTVQVVHAITATT